MTKTLMIGVVVLALASVSLGQGLPHMIYGWVRNYDNAIPDSLCLTFEAYVEGRPLDKLTERSYPHTGYSETDGGVWGINTAGFTPQPVSGQRIFISFRDTCLNQFGYDTVTVDNSTSFQLSDTTRLAPVMFAEDKNLPKGFSVHIFPNPFNSTVHIEIEYGGKVFVSAKIYDILGREIVQVYRGYIVDRVEIVWDGVSKDKINVPSGIYFLEMDVGESKLTRRLLYLK